MFDANALFDCLKEHKMSMQELAKCLGISRVTLYRKTAGESDFTRGEIQKCRELFGVEACERIFFALEVA